VQRSIATAPGQAARLERTLQRLDPALIGLCFVAIALVVYVFSHGSRNGFYNHFEWQAAAFLDGRVAIELPGFQDVMPIPDMTGYGLLPFPPLPAIVLLPFVAVFGMATDSQLMGAIIGAINVGLAWRLTTRLTADRSAAALATIFFGFGTVHWYAAMLSSTWFLAHVIAVGVALMAITLALDAERRGVALAALRGLTAGQRPRPNPVVALIEESSLFMAWFRKLWRQVDPVQFMAGFVFGVAALARLTVLFAAPFFVFVGGGGSMWRRAFSAGLGAAIPVALLVAYNYVSVGHIFNPAYEYLYQTEYLGYLPPLPPAAHCPFTLELCAGLEINRSYGIEDVRHVPLNALIMFAWPPIIRPECGLSFFDKECALLMPDQIGMSLLLTSPAYLLAVPYAVRHWRDRLVIGSVLAIAAVALLNLMHFSQGWVQFGYRFSNDFAPFALVLVTLAIASMRGRWRWAAALLVVASVVVNAWGVYWGVRLGW
jgi:hypothetical protein